MRDGIRFSDATVKAAADAGSAFHGNLGKFADGRPARGGSRFARLRERVLSVRAGAEDALLRTCLEQHPESVLPLLDNAARAEVVALAGFRDAASRQRVERVLAPTREQVLAVARGHAEARKARVPMEVRRSLLERAFSSAVPAAGAAASAGLAATKVAAAAGVAAVRTAPLAAGALSDLVALRLKHKGRLLVLDARLAADSVARTVRSVGSPLLAAADASWRAARATAAALAKFVDNSAVRSIAGAPGDRFLSLARRTALLGVVGAATFVLVNHAAAAPQTAVPAGARVTVTQQASQSDVWALLGQASTPRAAPLMGVPAGGVKAAPPTRDVEFPDAGSLPSTRPAPSRAASSPAPAAPIAPPAVKPPSVPPAAPAVPRPAGEIGPSQAFADIAEATIGLNTQDWSGSSVKIGEMLKAGESCMRSGAKSCRIERDGVVMDFGAGRYEAVMHPLQGVSTTDRTVAVEARGKLSVVDKDALVIVNHESKAAMLRDRGEMFDEPDGEAPAPH